MKSLCTVIKVTNNFLIRCRIYNIWKRNVKSNFLPKAVLANDSFGDPENKLYISTLKMGIENNLVFQLENKSTFEDAITVPYDLQCHENNKIKINDGLLIESKPVMFDSLPENEHMWSCKQTVTVEDGISITTKEELRQLITNSLTIAGNSCVISFGTIHLGNKRNKQLTAYGQCKYKTHSQKYKFVVTKKKMYVYVIGKGCDLHEGDKVYKQMRGQIRKEMKIKLEHKTPHNLRLKILGSSDLAYISDLA